MTVKLIDPTQTRLLTVEEWVQHPEADQYELIDGVLRARMVKQNQHEYAVIRVGRFLDEHLEHSGTPGSVFGSNTKFRIRARRGIMPDVSVVLGAKAAQFEPTSALNTVGPDLAVEVLSSEQGADYNEERLDDFWKLDTMEVWIVDPWTFMVTGYTRGARGFEVFGQAEGDEQFSSRLRSGLSFSVARLWMRRP